MTEEERSAKALERLRLEKKPLAPSQLSMAVAAQKWQSQCHEADEAEADAPTEAPEEEQTRDPPLPIPRVRLRFNTAFPPPPQPPPEPMQVEAPVPPPPPPRWRVRRSADPAQQPPSPPQPAQRRRDTGMGDPGSAEKSLSAEQPEKDARRAPAQQHAGEARGERRESRRRRLPGSQGDT